MSKYGYSKQVTKSVSSASTIHTPTGLFYLHSFSCSSSSTDFSLFVTDASDVTQYEIYKGGSCPIMSFSEPIKIPPNFKLKCSSAFGLTAFIHGVEL